jgi:uracil-DNA glycosylase family 4
MVEPPDRGFDDCCGTAVAAVRPVGTDCDCVEIWGFARGQTNISVALSLSKGGHCFWPLRRKGRASTAAARTVWKGVNLLQPAELSPIPEAEAPRDCPLCPRLVRLRQGCRAEFPLWWNAPVPAFGDRAAWLAIVGLAPGKHGANRTGRPFTGDFAGELLYRTLLKFGLAEGEYRADPEDGLRLSGAVILNAVKCLPPANKPLPEEIATCRTYFEAALAALPSVRAIIALGQIAHVASARALGLPSAATKFGHSAEAVSPDGRVLLSSYHCSRYNQNTGRLSVAMFESVFQRALELRCPR